MDNGLLKKSFLKYCAVWHPWLPMFEEFKLRWRPQIYNIFQKHNKKIDTE